MDTNSYEWLQRCEAVSIIKRYIRTLWRDGEEAARNELQTTYSKTPDFCGRHAKSTYFSTSLYFTHKQGETFKRVRPEYWSRLAKIWR